MNKNASSQTLDYSSFEAIRGSKRIQSIASAVNRLPDSEKKSLKNSLRKANNKEKTNTNQKEVKISHYYDVLILNASNAKKIVQECKKQTPAPIFREVREINYDAALILSKAWFESMSFPNLRVVDGWMTLFLLLSWVSNTISLQSLQSIDKDTLISLIRWKKNGRSINLDLSGLRMKFDNDILWEMYSREINNRKTNERSFIVLPKNLQNSVDEYIYEQSHIKNH